MSVYIDYKIFGLRKSGIHMIMDYIINNFEANQVYLFNNIENYNNLILNCKGNSRCFTNVDTYWLKDTSNKLATKMQYENFHTLHKKCLIEIYEDKNLDLIYEMKNQKIFNVLNRASILILRDPLNWAASRIKHIEKYNDLNMEITSELLKKWVVYAKEFLNYTNMLGNNKICINYVFFITDPNYRKEICNKLNIKLSQPKYILPFNKGSSFSGTILESPSMYLKRYKLYEDHEIIKMIKNNGEIMSLSDKIFGKIY